MMKKKDWIFIGVLAVILFVLCTPMFNSELIWDDGFYFKNNLLLNEHRPLTEAFRTGYFGEQMGLKNVDHYYRPLLTASFMIENKLWGIHPATLRMVNLLIFILAFTAFFSFLKRGSSGAFVPEIAVLLFALHPLNVDNILWAVARSDLLLLLFGCLAFLCLELFNEKTKPVFWLLGSASFLLGMFSKESFFLFWPALLVFEVVRRKKVNLPFHALNALAVALFFMVKTGLLGIRNPQFVLMPSLVQDVKVAVGTVGFYVKSLVWPFSPRLFLPLTGTAAPGLLALGAAGLLALAYLGYRMLRERMLAVPLALGFVFLAGHAAMAFSSSFPYTIYARYAMVPWLAIAWALAVLCGRLNDKVRLYPVLALVLIFLPTMYLNAGVYKSEVVFWQTAAARAPKDSYILYQSAFARYVRNDIPDAELLLNRALSLSIRRETAILISELYADVDIAKADYRGAAKWLTSISGVANQADVRLADSVQYQIRQRKAKLAVLEGDAGAAEKYLLENARFYPDSKETYTDLFEIYVGREMWDKAAAMEREIKARFPSFNLSSAKLQEDFQAANPDGRIGFYVRYRNFDKARFLIEAAGKLDLAHRIFRAKLLYWRGMPEEAGAAIEAIAKENVRSFEVMNSIAAFYLTDLNRLPETVEYLNRSLAINPDQPQIQNLAAKLMENYLKRMKPVWQ